jgi:hypothetical protein
MTIRTILYDNNNIKSFHAKPGTIGIILHIQNILYLFYQVSS